jgi:hypothetical protein
MVHRRPSSDGCDWAKDPRSRLRGLTRVAASGSTGLTHNKLVELRTLSLAQLSIRWMLFQRTSLAQRQR